jgi:hypothetical protein
MKVRLARTYVECNSRKRFVPTLKFHDQLAKTISRKDSLRKERFLIFLRAGDVRHWQYAM